MSVKIWKVSPEAVAQLSISEESVSMIGSQKRLIKVSNGGTVIYGPLSIVAGAESNRSGGMFAKMPDITQMIPSTEVTPVSHISVPIPPLHVGFDLANDVGFFAALLM